MDHAHRDLGLVRGEARQIGLGADDGERALVDRGAVAQIVPRAQTWPLLAGSRCARCARSPRAIRPPTPTACGISRAEPSAMSAQPFGRTDDGQRRGPGWAQPLAQPEMWIVNDRVEKRRCCRGDRRRHGAGGDVRGRADRRAGAGDDVAARIVGARDEAEPLGASAANAARRRGVRPRIRSARSGRRAQAARARAAARPRSIVERCRVGMTEGEADAARQRAVAQRDGAPIGSRGCLARCGRQEARRSRRRSAMAARNGASLRGEHVARARIAATPRNDFEQTDGGSIARAGGTTPSVDGARAVAADADAKHGAALAQFAREAARRRRCRRG